MIVEGKTLFFNESDGKGIIITAAKEKINFHVSEWNDYDLMPTTGLEVVFTLEEGNALEIVAKENYTQEIKVPTEEVKDNLPDVIQENLKDEKKKK